MTIRIAYPHISKKEGQPAHLERLPRIRVAQIAMDYIAYGWSVEEMCRQYPYLRLSEAYAAMGYYFDNKEEIDADIRSEQAEYERARAESPDTPFVIRMKSSGLL